MNKKAIAGTFLLILAIIIFSASLLKLHTDNKNRLGGDNFIGQNQIAIMNIFLEAEKDLLYLDKLGSYSLPNGLYNLAESGGFYEEPACGSYGNYNFWLGMKEDCYPDVYQSLPLYLQDIIKDYKPVLHSNAHGFAPDSYIFSLEENSYGTSVVAHPYKPILYEGMSDTFYMFTGDNIRYSVRPAFRAYENYYIQVYNQTYEKSQEIRELCMNKIDYQRCVEEQFKHLTYEMPSYRWKHGCDTGEEAIFYNLIEQIDACMSTLNDDCVCKLDLSAKEGMLPGEYDIKISSDGIVNLSGLSAKLSEAPTNYGENPYSFTSYPSISINLEYDENKYGLYLKKIELVPYGERGKDFSYLSIYKDYIEDPVVQKKNHFVFVEDDLSIPECNVFSRIAKVCVESKEEYTFYDGKSRVETSIPIKFAMYFNDIFAPEPYKQQDILVENKEDDERSVILTFPEHSADDIYRYNIYYTDRPFSYVDLPSIEKRELLATEFEGRAIINLLSDGEYFFAVLPEDVFGNIDENFVVVSGVSNDNLAPGSVDIKTDALSEMVEGVLKVNIDKKQDYLVEWKSSTLNADGVREIVDMQGYFIRISDSYSPLPDYVATQDCEDDPSCNLLYSNSPGEENFQIFKDLEPGEYFVVVSVFDDNMNYLRKMENDALLMASSMFESGNWNGDIYLELEMAEGGWVCDPDDAGGETYKGIAINFNDDWPYYDTFWEKVHDTTGFENCLENPIPSSQLNLLLSTNSEVQDLVREFYEWYMEKHGVSKISDASAKKLVFNFIFNTPVGTTNALYYAKYGEKPSSTTIIVSQDMADHINGLATIASKEAFAFRFSESMYSYYSKGQKKFRRGWFNRLKNGVNAYLNEIGSLKRIDIVEDDGKGKVVLQ